jgi:protein TonB
MRMRCYLALLLLLGCELRAVHAQEPSNETRKIVRKTDPQYPEIAKRMNLSGTVKVIAIVAPDGKVKSVEPVGGSPLLIQAAQASITQWKFAPAGAESKEVIELHFNLRPQ